MIIKERNEKGIVTKVKTHNPEPHKRAKQEFKDECDINYIMDSYKSVGTINGVAMKQGVYADLSGIGDLHEIMNQVKSAEVGFMSLSSKVRKRFANDPINLIEFLKDPNNKEEAIALGLVEQKEAPQAKKGEAEAPPVEVSKD